MANDQVASISSDKRAAIDAFRKKLAAQVAGVALGRRGRLIFAFDCTQSRQPTWDMACEIHAEMFQEASRIGGLEIQLATYGGHVFETSDWVSDGQALAEKMAKITCRTGNTQIEKLLTHAQRENALRKIQALVFVGDSMEESEDKLFAIARELGLPIFVFREGDDPTAGRVFSELARLTRGAHCVFAPGAARELAGLLRAVAAYTAGGRDALLANKTAAAAKLLLQLPPR
jgi:hypothetical protein